MSVPARRRRGPEAAATGPPVGRDAPRATPLNAQDGHATAQPEIQTRGNILDPRFRRRPTNARMRRAPPDPQPKAARVATAEQPGKGGVGWAMGGSATRRAGTERGDATRARRPERGAAPEVASRDARRRRGGQGRGRRTVGPKRAPRRLGLAKFERWQAEKGTHEQRRKRRRQRRLFERCGERTLRGVDAAERGGRSFSFLSRGRSSRGGSRNVGPWVVRCSLFLDSPRVPAGEQKKRYREGGSKTANVDANAAR